MANSAQLFDLLPLRRAGDQHAGQQIGQEAERILGGDDDGLVVDLLERIHHRHGGAHDRRGRRIVLRRLVVVDAAEVPDHRIGVELRAVMELHALANVADPAQRIGLVGMPGGEQPGRDVGKLVGVREVPVDDRVVGGIAEEAEPFAAVVGNAVGGRQICRGHADAKDLRNGGRRRQSGKCRGACRRDEASPGEHRAVHSLLGGLADVRISSRRRQRPRLPLPFRSSRWRRRGRSSRPSCRYRSRRRTRAPSPRGLRCARRH